MNYRQVCEKIKNLPEKDYFDILRRIADQRTISGIEHSSYHATFDLKITMKTKISFTPNQSIFFKIFFVNNEYDIFYVQIKHIVRYIDENQEKRYIFLPLTYTNYHLKKAHANCLVIDTQKKELFILEPNGVHPLEFVNKFIDSIVRDIRRYKPAYKFVPLRDWFLCGRSLNQWKEQDDFGVGICATICLFFIEKLISLGEKDQLDLFVASLTKQQAELEIKSFIDSHLN